MSDGTAIAASLVLVALVVALVWLRARRDAHRHELALLEARRAESPEQQAIEELRAGLDALDTRVNRIELKASFGKGRGR